MDNTTHPNAALVRDLVDCLSAGNLPGAMELFSPDTLYHVPGNNAISKTYVGTGELTQFFIDLMTMTEGNFRVQADEIMGDEGYAVMFWSGWMARNGEEMDAKGTMAFKVNPEGKVSESWFIYSDQDRYNAFYS